MSLDGILDFLRKNDALVEITLFVLAFAESLPVVSFVVPATALFLAIGALQEAAGGPFVPIAVAGALGSFVGDIVAYALGRYWRDELPQRWPFRSNPTWLPDAAQFLARWGLLGIVGAKFVGPLRSIAPTVCGVLQMPWLPFLIAVAVASAVWSLVLLAPVYFGMQLLGF